ncbi:MAG: enoyl-CoA hydratase-related protein, partial [Acidimicrobiales bacterium]
MPDDVVLYDASDGIATVTLNRPDKRNALNSEVLRLLPELMLRAERDPAVDVIILTGSDPAFCAGLDLKQLGDSGDNLRGSGADGTPNSTGV